MIEKLSFLNISEGLSKISDNFNGVSGSFSGIENIGICHYIVLALILFLFGLFLVISTRNLIKILIGLEFMLNAACINFAAINAYVIHSNTLGQVFAIIVLAIGAIGVAVGLTLITAVFHKNKNIDTKYLEELREEGGDKI